MKEPRPLNALQVNLTNPVLPSPLTHPLLPDPYNLPFGTTFQS